MLTSIGLAQQPEHGDIN